MPDPDRPPDFVVWRDAESGRELARTADVLPAVSTGTMVEPYSSGRMLYLAQQGQIIELIVSPSHGSPRLR